MSKLKHFLTLTKRRVPTENQFRTERTRHDEACGGMSRSTGMLDLSNLRTYRFLGNWTLGGPGNHQAPSSKGDTQGD